MQNTINHALTLVQEILPIFILAILVAALLDYFLPDDFFKSSTRLSLPNLLLASIIGALIPMCTCGMIPLVHKIHNKGVHWVLLLAFLIAGNASSIPALILSSVLGYKIVILRLLASIVFGVTVALLAYVLLNKETYEMKIAAHTSCCEHEVWYRVIWADIVSMLKTFFPWIILAVVIASLLHETNLSALFLEGNHKILFPIIGSLIGFPFYFCAGADVPLSQELLRMNVGVGTIISFMLAAPGTNLTSLFVYKQIIGWKHSIWLFVISLITSSLLGVLINYL